MAFGTLFHPERITDLLNFYDLDKPNKIRPSEDRYTLYLVAIKSL